MINKSGELIHIGLLSDITVSKSEEEIRLISIINAVENERGRLSRELHDGLAQLIVSSKLFLSHACDTPEDHRKMAEVFHLLDDAALECSTISTNLMPKFLHRVGLGGSLYEILNPYHKKIFIVSYDHNIGEERFNKNIETNIFRLVQESITNIVKYA